MGFLLFLAAIGVFLLIMMAVRAMISSGQESARVRSISVATGALGRQARRPGWRQVPDDEDVPAGRMSAAERTRRAAVAGTYEGRAVRVAVFTASASAGTWQGVPVGWTTALGLVVAVDAPDLAADLRMNPLQVSSWGYGITGSMAPAVSGDTKRKVLAQLESYQSPAVDVGDGVACFTFTDMDLAEQAEDLVAMAHDVVEILVAVRKPNQPVEE
jgi:hypothetical protein